VETIGKAKEKSELEIGDRKAARRKMSVGRVPGSGLTVRINPLSFPNRNAVLRGRMSRWKCPVYAPEIACGIF
jgi:hypothetical protein